jgi:hypothetical protein
MADLRDICEAINKEQTQAKNKGLSDLTKIAIVMALLVVIVLGSFGIGLWIMMVGWGLTPQSWGVIITGLIVQMGLTWLSVLLPRLLRD